jgi:hypothetical protein
MNPVELLLQGHKARAKQAARGMHIVDLSTMAIPFGFLPVDRWTLGAYLLGWTAWEKAEGILKR